MQLHMDWARQVDVGEVQQSASGLWSSSLLAQTSNHNVEMFFKDWVEWGRLCSAAQEIYS